MSIINIRKNQEQKYLEKRSKINTTTAHINRTIKQYEVLKEKAKEKGEYSLAQKNMTRAKVFAKFVRDLDTSIRGLNDFILFLNAIDISLQEQKTEHEISTGIGGAADAIRKAQLSSKQAENVIMDIESIISKQEEVKNSLSSEFINMRSAVEQTAGSYTTEESEEFSDRILKGESENTKENEREPQLSADFDKMVDNDEGLKET